jgi:hypothetical protein
VTQFGAGDPQSVNDFHAVSDVDSGPLAQHHTLGKTNVQSAPGSHLHQGADSAILNVQDLMPPTGSTQGDILVAGTGTPPLDISHVPLGTSGQWLMAEPLLTPGPRWVPGPGQLAPVRVVNTTNMSVTSPGTPTIDGVALTSGDRVLLTGQTSTLENGIWVYQGAVPMIRGPEVSISMQSGVTVSVTEGTVYNQTTWRNTNTGAITVGSTGQSWALSFKSLVRAALTTQFNFQLVGGTLAWSLSAAANQTLTVNYGVTFSVIPFFVSTVQTTSFQRVYSYINGLQGTSSASVRVQQGENTTITASGNLNWIAFGPI